MCVSLYLVCVQSILHRTYVRQHVQSVVRRAHDESPVECSHKVAGAAGHTDLEKVDICWHVCVFKAMHAWRTLTAILHSRFDTGACIFDCGLFDGVKRLHRKPLVFDEFCGM